MPKKIVKGVGMMQRHQLEFDPREPGAAEAVFKAWDEAMPVIALPEDLPGEALDRENAKRCRAILATVGLAELMEGKGAVNLGPLRERGFDEDSAQWMAAQWLGAYNRMMAHRQILMGGDCSPSNIGMMLMHAQELGRLQERMWWRAGIDPQTGKKRETLALSGRRQVKGGHNGNAMKGKKSFAETHGREAQARADLIAAERPALSWAAIRSKLAREFDVSAETIKKALRNPKKGG